VLNLIKFANILRRDQQ